MLKKEKNINTIRIQFCRIQDFWFRSLYILDSISEFIGFSRFIRMSSGDLGYEEEMIQLGGWVDSGEGMLLDSVCHIVTFRRFGFKRSIRLSWLDSVTGVQKIIFIWSRLKSTHKNKDIIFKRNLKSEEWKILPVWRVEPNTL